jgi:hypothetical protein
LQVVVEVVQTVQDNQAELEDQVVVEQEEEDLRVDLKQVRQEQQILAVVVELVVEMVELEEQVVQVELF